MTIADDFATQLSFLPQGGTDLTDFAEAVGGMFAEVEQYAFDPDDDDPIVLNVARENLCPTPNFDNLASGFGAWAPPTCPSGSLNSTGVVIGPTTPLGHSRNGRVLFSNVAAGDSVTVAHTAITTLVPKILPGQLASASIWVIAPTNTVVQAGVVFYTGDSIHFPVISMSTVSAPATGNWQQLVVTDAVAPVNSRFMSVILLVKNNAGFTQNMTFSFDGGQLFLGGPVPGTYWDGDTAGFQWTGTPSMSFSAPVFPLPQPGWSIMLDVNRAPAQGLPYLAQWVGERLPVGIAEDDARNWIRSTPNRFRGTPAATAHAVQRHLVGTKSVFTAERVMLDGTVDNDWVAIFTLASETPDQQVVLNELRKQIPSGIMIDYQVFSALTWGELAGAFALWSDVASAFATWGDVALSAGGVPPGFTRWTP